MAIIKYVSQPPPERNQRLYLAQETKRIEISINQLVDLLNAVGVPVQIGAPDSAGLGFRVLRIPN